MARGFVCLALLFLPFRVHASLLLNEVLYDPPGSDGGHEFVELFCAGESDCSLEGIELVFVNGADPTNPRRIWSAPPGLVLSAGNFLVLGEAEVPERDHEMTLGLQNGPDALQLWRGALRIDAVAWGEFEEGGEGPPAPDPSSASLGRVPDGADTDDNQSDWRALERPSPGAANARASRLHPIRIDTRPPWRRRAGKLLVELGLVAAGHAEHQRARLEWWREGVVQGGEEISLGREDTLVVKREFELGLGRHRLAACLISEEDSSSVDLIYQVGPARLRFNELMPRPVSGEPEWIELQHLDADTLLGWSYCDASRQWKQLPPMVAPSGSYSILCADPATLSASTPLPPGTPVLRPVSGWATLNNSQSTGTEFADELLLRDEHGVVVDHLQYLESELPPVGRTLERGQVHSLRAREWYASPGPPTPGADNLSAAYEVPVSGLAVRPDPFSPDGDGVDELLHVQLRGSPFEGRLAAEVRDLAGELVAELGVEDGEAEFQQWIWDGRDLAGRPVPMGAYVVVVRGDGSQASPRAWRALVALGRRP